MSSRFFTIYTPVSDNENSIYNAVEPPSFIEEDNFSNLFMTTSIDFTDNNQDEINFDNNYNLDNPFTTDNSLINTFESLVEENIPSTTKKSSTLNLGQRVVNYARTFKDKVPYIYATMDPKKGFDCSGLIKYCYQQFGVNLPRSSHEMGKIGTKVDSLKSVQPGDIIYCSSKASPSGGHVKMVSSVKNGDVYVIEAKGKQEGIKEDKLTYTGNILSIRRPTIPQNTNTINFSQLNKKYNRSTHNSNLNIIYNRLKLEGYNKAQISGLLANIIAESGGRADVINSSNHAGLCLWSLSQRKNFKLDVNSQLNYLVEELKRKGYNDIGNGFTESYFNLFHYTQDPKQAALAFAKGYERYGNNKTEDTLRSNLAEAIYNMI